jgi:predicted RNA-binding Zn-ribbon protein involved in translation (DUF1610 family)
MSIRTGKASPGPTLRLGYATDPFPPRVTSCDTQVAQRQRHVQVEHQGRAASRGARFAGGDVEHGHRRILGELDPDGTARIERNILRQHGCRAQESQYRQPHLSFNPHKRY